MAGVSSPTPNSCNAHFLESQKFSNGDLPQPYLYSLSAADLIVLFTS